MKLSMKFLPATALVALLLPGAALADGNPYSRFLAGIFKADERGTGGLRYRDRQDDRHGGARAWSHDNDDDDDDNRGAHRGRDDDDDDGRNDDDDDGGRDDNDDDD